MDYRPEGHEYTKNPTYTGGGCAHCGKKEEGHKSPETNKAKEPK